MSAAEDVKNPDGEKPTPSPEEEVHFFAVLLCDLFFFWNYIFWISSQSVEVLLMGL